jgi:peptide deformylase
MAVIPVVKVGDNAGEDVLSKVSREVKKEEFGTQELEKLIDNLKDTKDAEEGVGIAAPQIGVGKRVIVVGFKEGNTRYEGRAPIPVTVIINPVLDALGDEIEKGEEGCLSVPGVRALVPRYKKVHCAGFDRCENRLEFEASDFFARILQHECDHLDGKLFTSRVETEKDYIKK